MALQIKVMPNALRQGAEEIRAIINQSDVLNNRIQVLANKLDSAWDGSSSQEMVEKLLVLSKACNSAKEGMEESARLLQAIAQQFEQIDNGETGMIATKVDFVPAILGPCGRPDFLQTIKLSSDSIRVVPEELREVANESRKIMDVSDELANNLEQITENLRSSWEGRAYIRFSERFSQIEKFYIELTQMLDEFSQKIYFVAGRYEELDNMFG